MSLFERDHREDAETSIVEKISYLSGNMGNCIGQWVIGTFMLFYYTDVLKINAAIVASIMLISRIFDGFTDIIMGYIIDRTNSSKGKARVWVLRGCIPYIISVAGVFFVPSGASDIAKYVYIFVFYNLANSIMGTVINTSYNSMNSLITKKSTETGILGIFGMVGASLANMFVSSFGLKIVNFFGNDERAWHIGISILCLTGLALLLICYFGVEERVVISQQQKENPMPIGMVLKKLVTNKYWLMIGMSYVLIMFYNGTYQSSLLYYCKGVLGDVSYQANIMNVSTTTQVFATISALFFIKKIGKANTFRMGTVFFVLCLIARSIAGANPQAQIILGAFFGAGRGLMSANILGLLADTVEYGYWKNGVRIVGSAFAVMSFAAKIGNGLGGSVVGWLIQWSGYNGDAAVQTGKAIMAINTCFIYIPMLCGIVIFGIMLFYNLDNRFESILADNKVREAAA